MRNIARTLLLMVALIAILGFYSGGKSLAHHGGGHHCRAIPHTHSNDFYKEKAEEKGVPRGQIRKQHKHHKHACGSQYPPRQAKPNTSGQSATLPVESPPSGGLTVGVAAVIAMVGLGTLLIARRRWVFRTGRS